MTNVRATIENGLIDSEKIAFVPLFGGGTEEVVLPSTQAHDGMVKAWVIEKRGEGVLVELPRESSAGNWRIVVPKNEVVQS